MIRHGGALPELPEYLINMYRADGGPNPLVDRLAEFVEDAYRGAPERALAAE